MKRKWFDKDAHLPPDTMCACKHMLKDHPPERFRSCSRCLFCDYFLAR